MTVRILLLLFFCAVVSSTESFSQVFQEDLLKKGGFKLYKIDLKTSAKSVTYKEYYNVGAMLKFDLDLLLYTQSSNSAFFEVHYDEDGVIKRYVEQNFRKNSKGETLYKEDDRYTRNYNTKGFLVNRSKYSADTLSESIDLVYKHDEKDRIVEIKQSSTYTSNNKTSYNVEEIEYFDSGRRSTIYDVKDSTKTYRREYVYDLKDRLMTETSQSKSLNHGNRFRTDYYYSDNGKLETKIWFWYNPKTSITRGFENGEYIEYLYNEEGILNTVTSYDLEVEDIDGKIDFLKGRYLWKTKYKEKKEGNYILQKRKSKRNDRQAGLWKGVILDHNRNKILEYYRSEKRNTLSISKITYY